MGSIDAAGEADDFLGWLIDAAHMAGADALPALARESARRAGARDASLFLVDHEQTTLVPLAPDDGVIAIDGSDAGRAFTHVEIIVCVDGDGSAIWLPMLDGTDRLGVVRIKLDDVDEGATVRSRRLAGVLAELVATRSAAGDLVELRRRSRPMSLASELLVKMLPPLTHTTRDVVISCILAPCYEVGGDAFDYAVDEGTARFAIFDAMGHGLEAALLASVTLAAYRRARRRRLPLDDTYREITDALIAHFGNERFVTGIICELDATTGELSRINAGHPAAIRIDAEGDVGELPVVERSVPFGIGGDPVIMRASLAPGDRLIFFTDGVVEARDEAGEFFGLQRLLDLVVEESAAGHAAPELLRRLSLAVARHQKGVFQDDATTMIVEWRGPDRERTVI